ncbi:MAG: DUF5678 domain-containing protein [Candidatus Bathyarchaeia archaeon]
MVLIKGSLSKELVELFRKKAMERYGYSRGAISKALEAAIELWLQHEYEFNDEERKNEEAFEKLKDSLEKEYSGMYVAIAGGELVAVGETLQETLEKSDEVKPGVGHRLVFKVGEEYPERVRLGWRRMK